MSDSTSPAARRRALAARRRELLRRTLAAEGFTPAGDGAGESAGDGPVTGAVGRGRGDDAALPSSPATPARTGEVTDRRMSTRLAGDPRDATGMLTWVFDVPGDAETGERIRRAAVAVAEARPRLRTTVGLPATAAAPDATAPDATAPDPGPTAPGVERAVLPATAVVEPRADHPEPTTAAALARHAVDPSSEPPLRVRTLPAPDRPGRADLVISTHHCAADEHTWVLLLDGLGTALAGGTPAASTGVTGEDATPELVDTAARRRAEALRGVPVGPDRPDPFAADRGRADTASRRVELPVDAAWADALRRGAREAGTTPPAVLVDAAARVLARRGAGDVPVVGTPADVRVMLGAGAWDDDGDRVSVIPVAVDTRRPVADGVAAVQEAVRDRCAGLDDVLRLLDLPTSPDRHALVDAVVTHRSGRRTLTLDGGEVTGTYAACGASAFDLVLALEDDGTGAGGAVLSAEARCSAPGPDVARLILAEWRDAVARSVGAEGPAGTGPAGTGAEGPASPGEVGGTTPTAAAPVTAAPGSGSPVGGAGSAPVDVAAAVARAARDAATAGAVAVSCGGRTLTYAQLDRAVDATVGVLRDAGARPGDVVALRLHRGAGVPVAMLAALRAGTPFVAVDPGQPAGRAAAVLAAADPRADLDDATVEAVLDGVRDAAPGGATDGSAATVAAAPAAAGTPAPGSAASFPSDGAPHPDSPAYLVFTSGTTGTPKGVTVPRRGLDAVLGAAVDMLGHGPGVTSLAGSTLGFDISVVEMLGALAAGGRVHVAPATFASDPAAAVAELRAVRPHIVEATPSLWSEILACDPTVVRGVLACAGGEALPAATATGLRAAGADVLNLYGPSEMSVIATAHRVTGDGTPPLGAVLPGLRAEVLDARLRPVPDGAVGELYLSGPQVALGYLGAPGTTAAAFVAGPGGRRRYRTGDLVSRRVPDGALRFHGRADDQLSLRGLRIELAEVEAALTAAPAVAAAAVRVTGAPGREVLLGYVVTTATGADPVPGIRAALTATLPSGARPARITVLDHLPRNANGKVDRAALPVPADLGADTGAGPDAVGGVHPTPTERTVTAAVRDVLGLADTPPTGADVRSLGGHSLLAHRLALRLSADLGVTVPAREVLADGTLADLARTCDDLLAAGGAGTPATGDAAAGPGPTGGVAASSPDHQDTPGPVEPLPGQRRIVTAEALDDTPGLYTLPVIVECDTAPAPEALGRALQEVCRRHPVLRTRPRLDGGRVVSTLLAAGDVPAPPVTAMTTTRELTPVVLRDLLATPFTAADGPVRAAVVTRRDAPPVVALLLHHAWADEWSLGPFFADLAAALGADGRHDGDAGDAGDPGHGSTAGRPEGPSYAAVRDALGAGSAQDRAFWAGRRHALAPAETPLPFSRSSRPDGAARGAGDAPAGAGAGAGGTTGAGGDVHLTATVPAPGLARGDAAAVVRAAVLLLLDRAGAEPVVGVPVAGRHDARLLDVVGYLGNTLPVTVGDPGRGVLAPGAPVRGVVDAVRAEVTDVALRSSVPLEELTDGGVPFRVLVDHRVGDVPVPDVPGWNARPVDPPTVPAKFPLTVMVTEPGADPVAAGHDDSGARDDAADMRLDLLFSGAEFDADGARSFAAALRRVVTTVARAVTATAGDDRAPGRREPWVADVALGTVPATVTTPEGTGRAATLARRHGVAAAVDDALRRCRDLPVLTGRGETLTGGQVLAATAAVADAVTDAVGGPDGTTGTVAVHLGARRDEVLALLGVLRTGRPFTVLRQDDPPGRLSAALADAQVTAVLTDRPGLLTGAVAEGVVVPLPGLPGTGTDPAPGTTRDPAAVPVPARPADGDPAYVCFTSGTTGRPKGVMVGHGALAGLLDVSDAVFAPDGDAALARGVRPRFVSVAPMHFDVGVLEVLATLTTGGHLLVADDADRVGTALARTVTRHRATHMSVTPTVLAGLGDPAGIGEDVVVFSGAEPLPVDLALAWADRHRLINLYGPTEATVNALHGDVDPATVRRTGTVPVGEADPGTAALVLDAALRPVPDGMPGELWLAGTGLALGYPASPGLTAARFTAVPDEWGLAPGARMYRTGDLAVRAADGTVTCTGRIDDQFKIRGLRVEPGDIEAAFRADGRVAAAVAVPVAGRRDTLAAGVVPAAGAFTDADLEELRRGVARVLPRYLVPQRVVALAALPVTPNGKTDRRQAARDVAAALEAGGGVAGTAAAATVATGGAAPAATAPVDAAAAPDDPALAALVTALTAVLDPGSGVPTAEDSVLGLGGDSIGALEIVARLRDAGWTVTPRDVLDAPTLAALAATMRRTGGGADGSDGPDDGAARAAAATADANATATAPGAPGDSADAAGIAPTGRFTPGRVAGEFVAESPEALLTQTMLLAVPSSAVGRVAGMVERLVDLHPALRTRTVTGAGGVDPVVDRTTDPTDPTTDPTDPTPVPLCETLPAGTPGTLHVHPPVTATGPDAADTIADLRRELDAALDVTAGRLTAVAEVETDAGPAVALTVHHLAVDAASWSRLIADLRALAGGRDPGPAGTSPRAGAVRTGAAGPSPEVPGGSGEGADAALTPPTARIASGPVGPGDTAATAERDVVTVPAAVAGALVARHGTGADLGRAVEEAVVAAVRAVDPWGPAAVAVDVEGHGRGDGVDPRAVGWWTRVTTRRHVAAGAGAGGAGVDGADAATVVETVAERPVPRDRRADVLLNHLGTTGTVVDPGAFTPLALPGVPPVDAGVGPDTPLRSALTVTSSVTPAADGPVLTLTLVRATRLVPAATAAAVRGHVLAALADGVGLGGGSAGLTVLPVTPTQEGLVLIDDAADPGAAAYVVRMAFTVSGLRDARALARAWRRLGDRHPALAATFHRGRDGRVRAVSGPGTAPSAEIVDAPGAAGDPVATPFDAPFDLARGPLARLRVTPGPDGRHRVEVALHHVIADGWSAPVIMRDLFALLAADARPADPAATDPTATDPAARVDPVPALAAVTARRHPDRRWRRLLRDARPTALAPGGTDDGTRADTVVTLDPATTRGLAAVARERRTTVAALLHGAWAVVTAARTGQSGVTSGSVVSGRPTGVPGAAEAVGMFAATVPVAVRGVDPAALDAPDPAVTARAVADAARGAAETLRLAADVPPSLAAVQALSGPARASGEALFDSLVVVENYPLDPAAVTSPVEGVTVSDLRYTDGSHYPVMLVVNPGERLRLRLAVAGGVTLASGAAPEEVLDDLARACRAVAGTSLPPDRTGVPPLSGPAPLLAAEGVAVRWSAAEAARAVDALAAHLLDRGAGPGVTVGVALPRGVEQVCSVLAVWRAGGAVMPLEVDGNGELTPRSGEILARSGATLLLDRNTVTNVLVEGVAGGRAASTPGPRRRRHLDPGDPAYVIHTSGTTGDPKGVTVPWRVLDGLLRHQVAQGVPAPGDVLAHLAPDQFDVAVQEVATAALGGHRLVVVDDATRRDTAALARVLDDEGVDVVFATTTLLDALAAHHARTGAPVLRTLVQAGERLDPGAHLRAWCTAPDGPVLRNDYGPTETHVCLSTVVDPDVLRAGGPVPVGEALPHVTAAVLGPDLAPVADGVTGELYIAGDVADGYAGDPALTATRFVAAPGGGRWHRTGDLARRGAGGAGDGDGAVVVLGRADDQAKIHGVRVHPAEVAAAARRVPGVGAAVAVVVDGRLCLAVTGSGDDAACAPEDVRRALEAWATGDGSGTTGPALVPAEVLVLDALPTGATGKADRRAVADLFRAGGGGGPAGAGAGAAAAASVAPTTPTTPTAAAALPVTLAASALRRVLVEDGTLPEDREVGPADDIVALGGSSLSAVRWAARVSAVLGTPVTVRTVMEERTPARVAAAVAGGPRAGHGAGHGESHGGDAAGQGAGRGTGAGAAATAPETVRRPAPDTPLEPTAPQRRFWALSRVDPAGVTYTLPLLAEFTADPGTAGTATAESLAAAVRDGLAALVRRHESLRTLVTGGTDGPRQVIVDPDSAVDMLDVAVLPPGEEVTDHRRRPFRLDRELPVRAAVAPTGPGRALVSLVFHHVAVDGWSLPVVVDDLAAVWSASSPTGATDRPVPAGAPAEPPTPAPSPAAITAAQDRWRTRSSTADRDLAFWRETLADLPCPMPLPLDRPRSVPGEDTPGGRLLRIPLPPAEADRLVETARALDATPFMLLHAAVAAVLSRMGCGEDIVVTTPESGRSGAGAALVADPADPVAADLSTAVGCFVNLLVLRVSLAGDPEVREIVDRVRAAGLAAVEHAGTPFEDLVRELAAGGVTGHHPLATVGVGVQTFPAGLPAPRGWSARVLDDDPGVSRFDLNVDLVTGSGEACLAVEFDTALFDTRTVRRLVDRVRRVLATAAEAPGTRLSRLPVLLDDERLRLPAVPAPTGTAATGDAATGHTATGTGDPGGRRRSDLVRGVPTAGAVVGPDGRRIPADELRDRVDTLARDLVARGVRPGDVVAVSCDRDAGLVVAQLAVLRTGAAYVPLIPGTPEERRRVVLAETGAGVVLTSGDVRDVLSGATATATDAGATDAGAGTPALPDPADIPGDLPAYVLFTSGSTGRPKGVTVTRDALGALLAATDRAVPLGADDVVLAVSPFGFDIAGWELLAPLAGGAALVVADEDERRDPDAILGLVRRHGVTVCEATPGLWSLVAEAAARGHAASTGAATGTGTGTGAGVTTGPLHGLRALAGGEELPRAVAEALAGVGAQVWNLYGPTEVTVIATAGPWTGGRPDIGTPLPGVTAVVLDDRLAPVPEGALGELYLSGPQVAAGYLGAPAGTAAAFVADPWGAGTVMYRTGDLVRRRADGTFHYEGRRDGQVQVRGHRVEPAEVTSALLRQRGVRAAAVRVLDRGGATTLVGYAVTDRPATDPTATDSAATATDPGTSPDLLAALRRELPEYLVPSQVVTVAELPVTANGKVDVDALPLPPAARWEAPRPGTERTLAEIVAELLDIDVPGRHDGFLALGGDSITAVRLAARATEVGLALGTADVVRAGTIAELAETADRAAAGRPEVGDDAHPSATADSTGATATAGGSTGAGAEDGVDTPAPTPTGGTGGSSPVGDLSGLSAGDLDRVAAMFGGFAPGAAPGSGPGSADPDPTDPGPGPGGPGVTDPHSTDPDTDPHRTEGDRT